MSARLFVASFENEEGLVEAAAAARKAGFPAHDAFTPYAVHGLDEALGLPRSRLTLVCFGCGLFGLLAAFLFQWWTSSVDWPLNVGGKPPASNPAFILVTFEAMVLLAGVGTVAAFFVRARLYPGSRPAFSIERVTDDRFALAFLPTDGGFDEARVRALCESSGAVSTGFVEGAP